MSDITREERALTRAAELVRAAHGELRQVVDNVPARLAAGGQWEGAGSQAFTRLVQVWNTEGNKVVNALNDFEANLVAADTAYTQNDQAQQDTYTQIASRLQG